MNNVQIIDLKRYDAVLGGLEPQPDDTAAVLGFASRYALREYQKDLVQKIFNSWEAGNKRIMLQLATGGGKTIVFTDIVKTFLLRDLKSLVIALQEVGNRKSEVGSERELIV